MKRTAQKTINRTAYRSSQKNTGKKSSLFSRIISSRPLNSFGVLIALVCVLAALTVALVALPTAEASSPDAGTINITSSPITWKGTATAGGALGDPLLGLITSEYLWIDCTSCYLFT